MAASLDFRQLRSGPDAERDLTLNLYEWRGEVWGVLSGAGFTRGYVAGRRTDDTVILGITALASDGAVRTAEVPGTVLEQGDGVALELDWTIGPRRLESTGAVATDGVPPPLDQRPGASGTVRLVEIDESNLQEVMRVRVAPDQADYVADNARSIAEAHIYQPAGWYRAVYDEDVCVGFVMLAHFDDPDHHLYPLYHGWYLWRLLIGAAHQRRGYGTQVIELVCRHIESEGGPQRLTVSWHDEVGGPEPFYRGLGFEPTGEIDDGEPVGVLTRWPGHADDPPEPASA
jgi:diamine N-acetyltransferase